jgi:hypothetical protein
MLKTCMNRRRKNQVSGSQLFDAAETLEFRRVHELHFKGTHFNIAVDGVADEFLFAHVRKLDIQDLIGPANGNGNSMITYPFYDFEIERLDPAGSPNEIHLVKILSIDGRRFTYEVHGELTEEAVNYIKWLIDAVVFSDMIIEKSAEGFEVREARRNLKKHS